MLRSAAGIPFRLPNRPGVPASSCARWSGFSCSQAWWTPVGSAGKRMLPSRMAATSFASASRPKNTSYLEHLAVDASIPDA
jgi:hypothetical protein